MKLDFRSDIPMPPSVFNSFKQLVHIDMSYPCPLSTDTTDLRLDTLASLQELRLTTASPFLNTLSVLRLPNLRVVIFSGLNPPVDTFMETCGAHVEELQFSGAADFLTLFRNTPRLRALRWGPAIRKHRQYQDVIATCFEGFGPHPRLQKLTIMELPGCRCDAEKNKIFKLIFDNLHLVEFPSLRELRFDNYRWPDEERSIQRDVLPGITMAVKREYSIEITDLTGKSWRPRVQKDRLGLAHKRG